MHANIIYCLIIVISSFTFNICDASLKPIKYWNRLKPARLSLADDWTQYNFRDSEGPGTYSFGYDLDDSKNGNVQFRSEDKLANGSVTGSYGFVSPEGSVHIVHYIADRLGYRARIEEEDLSSIKNNLLNFDATELSNEKMSLQMKSVIRFLTKFNLYQNLEEQHTRPVDRFLTNEEKSENYN